jgi:hypothetical protein
MHSISWNEKAVAQAKAQGFDNPKNATCAKCGTQPALRQFRQSNASVASFAAQRRDTRPGAGDPFALRTAGRKP